MTEAFKTMLTRYEDARLHCLRMAHYHPDSREVCHQTLASVPTSTGIEIFLAGLLDDMALAMKQALNEQGAAKTKPHPTVTAIRQDGEPS